MRRLPTLLSAIVILVLGSASTIPQPSTAAQEATPIVETESGVTFGEPDGQPLKLDVLLLPDGDQSRPAVIHFHGWGDSRYAMTTPAKELAQAGYVAFTAD
jgi:cephalosporin-C deacetylase-like acetyl esterase